MNATVSVIIPAFNAARWIRATIASACAQTHRDLQIIVVDDGSQDETAAIVSDVMRGDSRIMLIRQPNGGVARARNAGLAASVGSFIAPLDADDLWSPSKIALQLDALRHAPPGTALAYNWYRRIDGDGHVLPISPYPRVEGSVFLQHLEWNFISNGSTPLIRADVARDVRYDPALRDAGNEGTEDYLFQLQIARRHGFVCVPHFLTAYRTLPGTMGAAPLRMAQSHLQTFAIIRQQASADACRVIARRSATYHMAVARLLGLAGDMRSALHLAKATANRPYVIVEAAARRLHRSGSEPAVARGELFQHYDTAIRDGVWHTRRSARLLSQLAELDGRTELAG